MYIHSFKAGRAGWNRAGFKKIGEGKNPNDLVENLVTWQDPVKNLVATLCYLFIFNKNNIILFLKKLTRDVLVKTRDLGLGSGFKTTQIIVLPSYEAIYVTIPSFSK